jgi:dephospho-CoA kinase
VLRVGLTGGIGSGKSTVGAALTARGAVLVDSDRIAREVVEPGTPALEAIADRFGRDLVDADGRLRRRALAEIVFADPAARADLNAITHPAIGVRIQEQSAAWEHTDRIVVVDIPLLGPDSTKLYGLQVVVVVDVPVEVAVDRLVHYRDFTEQEARARVAAQISREDRRRLADLMIDNGGSREDLEAEVNRAWADLQARRDAVG